MNTVKNSYPEKKEVAFVAVPIPQQKVIDTLKLSTAIREVKIAALIIMRNETGNYRSVINGSNPCGCQGDSGRWASLWDSRIVATCVKNEGMTGKERRFIVFDNITTGIAFLINRIEHKGLFIGEQVNDNYFSGMVKTVEELAQAYWDSWVVGEKDSKPSAQFVSDFVSMYKQAALLFA